MKSRPKKVILVQTQAENAGAQEVARQLALGAERSGWMARQVFFFRRTDAFDADENVFFCTHQRPKSPMGILSLFRELYCEFQREAPDAVVTFQHYGNLIAAPIARLAGVPLIVANQSTDANTLPAAVRVADRLLGQIGAYDHIVVNSDVTEAAYKEYPASYHRRLVRIDHGFYDKSIAMDKKLARVSFGLPSDVELLGCAARLHPLKQLDLAVRILAVNTRQHLALAGQGADLPRLQALAQELGVTERVHFLGELNAQRMGAFFAAIDCFVFPSAAETFGLAPVEAAQAGVPVIANHLDVLREVLTVDGAACAHFVDAHDTSAFASAVTRVFSDPVAVQDILIAGRRLTLRFPLDKMVDEYLRLMAPKAA